MEAFQNTTSPPISAVEERFRKLNIDGCPIEIRKYPEEADTKVLMDALLGCGYVYRQDIQSKAELNNMPLINEFLSRKDHFRETPYRIKFQVCGKNRCRICSRVGRTVWTPTISDGAPHNKVLRWIGNPMPDLLRNNVHYLSPEGMREQI